MNTAAHTPDRAIRIPQVCSLTGQAPATVWRRVKTDPSFPRPYKLGPKVTVWSEAEVLGWLDAKKAQRDASQ
jgi:predicted DNA-binding transcriptional regulator AlpA